ncbi:MAG: dihydrodipicolinate synthase family protein [Labrys sp. (in: a-proteobacteria)]|jgi:dihydrodipicolinate synthase/N-acetylneuraminate lyase
MSLRRSIAWKGVFPAVTVQYRSDPTMTVDLDATARVIAALIDDGVSGLIINGTVGENCSLSASEKRAVLEVAVATAAGRVPVLTGIAEYTAAFASETARMARSVGADGIMLMPAMVYSAKPHETVAHFRTVAAATDLPVMVYNNPLIYKIDVTPDMLAALADVDTIVCFKESSGDTRRFVDMRNKVGDRFIMFAGLDDVVLESVAVGAEGWVSGLSNVFPREGETLFRLASQGRFKEAMPIYDWFMPLLHLDARSDLVQCIKLCEFIAGRGTHLTRPPRLPLPAADHAMVEGLMRQALATRPTLPDVGLLARARAA